MMNLTRRETEVVKLLAQGKTNQEIGKHLFISVHTVKSVLENIYKKTNCRNRIQVVVLTIKNDMLN